MKYLRENKVNIKNIVSKNIHDKLISVDPTKTKKYVSWLAKQYIKESYNISSIKSLLEEYEVFIKRGLTQKRDINQFKTLQEFKEHLEELNNTTTASNKEMENDFTVLLNNDEIYVVRPNTHEASRKLGLSTFAGRHTGDNKDSAWCTTYKSNTHWNDYYLKRNVTFYYILFKQLNNNNKMIAFTISPDKQIDAYNINDKQLSKKQINKLIDKYNLQNILIPADIKGRKEKYIKSIIKLFQQPIIEGDVEIDFDPNLIINVKTTKINGSLTIINNDFKHFPNWLKNIEILNNFYCFDCISLTSLQGAPQSVGNNFYCYGCTSLSSLQGAPQNVNDFYCFDCTSLTSLQGAPQKVGGTFNCSSCTLLTSLQGAPQKVGDSFNCYGCASLTSLQGAPQNVGNFYCNSCTSLTSLQGAPQNVGNFYCDSCKITEPTMKKVIKYMQGNKVEFNNLPLENKLFIVSFLLKKCETSMLNLLIYLCKIL